MSARAFLVIAHAFTGNFLVCASLADEAIDIAKTADHPYSLAFADWGSGTCFALQGELGRAITLLERGTAVAHDWSIHFLWPLTAGVLGYAQTLAGRAGEGVALLEQALARTDAMAHHSASSFLMPRMSEVYLLSGRTAEAGATAERALATSRERGERAFEAEALHLLGAVASRRDPLDLEPAERNVRDALKLAGDLGMRPLVAHCHLSLEKLYWRTGKREQAREHLTTATTMYREMDMRFWLAQAEAEIRTLGTS